MFIVHALLTLLGLALFLLTLPLTAELLTLSLAALLKPRSLPPAPQIPINLAVIIPAHNEARLITACIASLQQGTARPSAIYVIAHNCTDDTAAIATASNATALPLTDDGSGGKGSALHFGFAHALAHGATAALVIDADSRVSPNLIAHVQHAFATGIDALQCRYIVANAAATPRTRLMALAFLGMNVLRPRGRARLGLSCGIFGNGFALSAATLERVPYLANSVVEDLEYHLLLIRHNIRVHFLDAAEVLGEMPDNPAAAATQRARWEGGRLRMRRHFAAPLFRDVLRAHLTFLEPLLDLLALPLATQAIALLVAAALPLHWLRVYAAAAFAVLLLYVVVAANLGPRPTQLAATLLAVPQYILFKLGLLRQTHHAAADDAAWVRTERNQTPKP